MYKCVKILLKGLEQQYKTGMRDMLQVEARNGALEGVLLLNQADGVHIIAGGTKESVDIFLDAIQSYAQENRSICIEMEALLKEKDYRGVFRIIE